MIFWNNIITLLNSNSNYSSNWFDPIFPTTDHYYDLRYTPHHNTTTNLIHVPVRNRWQVLANQAWTYNYFYKTITCWPTSGDQNKRILRVASSVQVFTCHQHCISSSSQSNPWDKAWQYRLLGNQLLTTTSFQSLRGKIFRGSTLWSWCQ